jgi:glycosyltransferase involved in cell wall biosynthesis
MPVRNEERFLPAALASLFRQTLTAWELVVEDDGSNDGTPELLRVAAAADRRVRVLRNAGSGLVDALNHGLAHCSAEFVARMDGDDVSHPRRLERQAAALDADPGLGLVASRFRHFPRRLVGLGMLAYEQWQNALLTHDEIMRDRFVESPVIHPSVMVRRLILEEVGGYRQTGWAEDYDLWLRLATEGVRFGRLPEILFFWRERPERATRTMEEYAADAFRSCKIHHLRRGFLKDVDQVTLAGAGLEGRAWQRALARAGVRVVRWLDVDPRKQGRTLHGAPVTAPDEVLPGREKVLITVGTRGARDGIRTWARGAGLREGEDFVCVT